MQQPAATGNIFASRPAKTAVPTRGKQAQKPALPIFRHRDTDIV